MAVKRVRRMTPEALSRAAFHGQQSIQTGREATLFRWRFGPNPPNPTPHHDVHILVRLHENDRRTIGTYIDQ